MRAMKTWSVVTIIAGLVALPAWARQAQTQPAAGQTQPAGSSAAAPVPAAPAPAAAFDPSKSDEKAITIVDKVIAAMGGDAWAKARFIRFTWTILRSGKKTSITHYWDRFEQRSRMEGPSREGKPVVAIVDHRTRQGQATLDGQLLFNEDAKKYTDIAYGRLINDSYWLFMQFKLKDPGVRLRYEGELKAGPVTYDKVLVSFDDGIGLTSKDKYWLYVNRATSMIERWSYVLQDQGASATPQAWEWNAWADVAGMKLSMHKMQPGGDTEIMLENVQVFDSLPETVFTTTAPVNLTAAPAPAVGQ